MVAGVAGLHGSRGTWLLRSKHRGVAVLVKFKRIQMMELMQPPLAQGGCISSVVLEQSICLFVCQFWEGGGAHLQPAPNQPTTTPHPSISSPWPLTKQGRSRSEVLHGEDSGITFSYFLVPRWHPEMLQSRTTCQYKKH